MKYLLFLARVLASQSLQRHFILKSLIVSFLYVTLSLLLINYKSYLSFAMADYDFLGKVKVLLYIFLGSLYALSIRDIVLLLASAILFGANVELVLRKIKFLASYGSLHITLGTGLITLAATGCASCGLSLASVVGLGGVLALLPFQGVELYVASILILLASLFYNLHTLVKVCNIKRY